jgi:signal transduction histidine kinase
MPLPRLERSAGDRVVAGVCGGIASALGVDATLVRLVFALLALAGGAGILLYLAAWAATATPSRRQRAVALTLVALAALATLQALGLSGRSIAATALVGGGLVVIWRRPRRPQLPAGGLALVAAGIVLLVTGGGPAIAILTPGAAAAALLLVVGPWLWRLALERDAERAARARAQERAEMAARVHDSVLQTLALVQRHAQEPRRVTSLARRQERELRAWLYGEPSDGDSLVGALAGAAAEIEELHGVRIELTSAGDCPLTDAVRPLVLAAREAMVNAAKFSAADEVTVFAEADNGRVSVFVRDRGVGFDRAAVPPGRRGLAESVEGRMARHGGTATVTTAPGEGTEVELTLPRDDA